MKSVKVLFCIFVIGFIFLKPEVILAAEYDAYEYDNYFTQANLIWNGLPQQHSIYPVGDEDWVKFTIPRDCNVAIETSGTTGNDTVMWLYDGTNPTVTTIYQNNFDTNPGWTTQGQWAFGQPTGQGGENGYPDPVSGYSGANVYGYNLNGDYPNDLNPAQYLTTTAINCSGYGMVTLRFQRWLGVERWLYDGAIIEVSNDGLNWYSVWMNPDTEIADSEWTLQEFNIASIADNQATVYIRWGMGPTDSSWTYCGWNIDDVEVTGVSYATGLTLLEFDDDDGTDLFSYIDRICGEDPLSAGTYYVQIEEYGDDNEIDAYFLNVTIVPCLQRTLYVDDDAAGDPGPGDPSISDPAEDGTPDHPYDAIQEAIDVSIDDDTIMVKDGIYSGAGNHNLDFSWDFGYEYHRRIEVISENGAASTIIDCTGENYGFTLQHHEGTDSVIEGFTIQNASHSGINLSSSGPAIRFCIFTGNGHVGISSYNGAPTIYKCTLMNNGDLGAGFGAGGIYCAGSDAIIEDCVVANNAGTSFSGGIIFEDCYGNPVVLNTLIYGNSCVSDGGGVATMWSYPTLINCVIMGNFSAGNGGGLYLMISSDPTFLNCTITGNEASGNGGGLYSSGNSNPVFTNTILWKNIPGEIELEPSNPGTPIVQYCDIKGGWSGAGSNNIEADPNFIAFDLGISEIPHLYYRLATGSPCIDAGTSNVGHTIDIDYKLHWDDPQTPNTGSGLEPYYDIGAYEFKAFYVATGGNDSWDGLKPAWDGVSGPKKTIQAAINMGATGEQIIVAPGIYTGSGNRDLNYYGKDVHLISEGGPLQTVIDCQGSSSNEHRGFLFADNETPKAVVKGFTIRNGYLETEFCGGAIFCSESDPSIFDCKIENCYASYGGGISAWWASPTIAHCMFNNNYAPTIETNTGDGGAIEIYFGSPLIKSCLITNNSADRIGGGICTSGGDPVISHCTIYGNTASDTAYTGGGGIYIDWTDASPRITNCITWNNSPDSIKAFVWATPVITYSDIQGGTGQPWFGTGCIDISPDFVVGPLHNFYLSQTAAGQSTNSPCVDTGEASAEYYGLNRFTTRTDEMPDTNVVDMGFHVKYGLRIDDVWKSSGDVTIHWNAIPGISYVVERSIDSMASWELVDVGAVTQWTDTDAASYLNIFYRVWEE